VVVAVGRGRKGREGGTRTRRICHHNRLTVICCPPPPAPCLSKTKVLESAAGSQIKICIASKPRDEQPIQLGNRAHRVQYGSNGIRDDSVQLGLTDIVVPRGKLAAARESLSNAGLGVNLHEEVHDNEDGQADVTIAMHFTLEWSPDGEGYEEVGDKDRPAMCCGVEFCQPFGKLMSIVIVQCYRHNINYCAKHSACFALLLLTHIQCNSCSLSLSLSFSHTHTLTLTHASVLAPHVHMCSLSLRLLAYLPQRSAHGAVLVPGRTNIFASGGCCSYFATYVAHSALWHHGRHADLNPTAFAHSLRLHTVAF
jgi:hypothetical protein